jgi:hypothetical protein
MAEGDDVTVPVPVPVLETESVCAGDDDALNEAVTDFTAFIVT